MRAYSLYGSNGHWSASESPGGETWDGLPIEMAVTSGSRRPSTRRCRWGQSSRTPSRDFAERPTKSSRPFARSTFSAPRPTPARGTGRWRTSRALTRARRAYRASHVRRPRGRIRSERLPRTSASHRSGNSRCAAAEVAPKLDSPPARLRLLAPLRPRRFGCSAAALEVLARIPAPPQERSRRAR